MASIGDQNWIVWNQGKNPLVNFNFMLRVEMMFDLPCRSVKAFSRELEYDYIQEGGLNDYVHMRRKPISRPFTLEVERYVGVDYQDPLPLGADLVLPVLLFVSRAHDQFIPGVVARTYVFTGCTVMKKTYGDLVADQSGLLVETTTIGYREMLCVDIPWSEVGDNIFGSKSSDPPTRAATTDKTAGDFKKLGKELYEKAKQAKAQADTEYQAEQAEKLIKNLEEALKKLEKDIADTGKIGKALADAKAGLEKVNDSDEAEKKVQEARKNEQDERDKVRLSQDDWAQKNKTYHNLLSEQAAMQDRQTKAAELKTQLQTRLTEAGAEKTALEGEVPEAMREPEKAQAAVDEARIRVEKAGEAMNDARREQEQAQRELDSKKALEDTRKAEKEKELDDRLRQAAERRNTLEDLVATELENNLRLAEEVTQAEEAYTLAKQIPSNDPEEGEENAGADAQQELERAKAAKEQSDAALKKHKEDLEQAVAEEKAAKEAAEAGVSVDTQKEETALAAKTDALEKAVAAHAAAAAARKAAEKVLENSNALHALTGEIEDLNVRIKEADKTTKEAKSACDELAKKIPEVKLAVDEAEKQLNSDKARLESAKEVTAAAEAELAKVREDMAKARDALKKAEGNYNRVQRNLNPIRNNLTNLKARKEKSDDYLKSCADSLTACETANTTLQGLPDDPLSAVNSAYEEVRKHYNNTSFYERQLREIKTYIDQGSELYEQVKELVEEPPAEGGDTPTEGNTPPAEGGDTPTEGNTPPAEGGDTPTEGNTPPAEGGDTPTEGNTPPAEGGENNT